MIFIPSKNTNMEWAEKYTRSSYKSKPQEEIDQSLYNLYSYELEKYGGITIDNCGERKKLSYEDSLKLLKCFTCDKKFENNARRYCSSCEYYTSSF